MKIDHTRDEWPVKAYENLEFLHSPQARTIRVLAEFIEPNVRFGKEQVHNTIVFFGSARIPSHETGSECDPRLIRYYEDAKRLAFRLCEWSNTIDNERKRFIICSGGGPGIMEAANRGAEEAHTKSIGLNISLPHEQTPNPYQTQSLSFEFHYFFIRKFWFFYLAKAMVVFPGGFGTMDEFFELLTLVQTRKTDKYLPIILYGTEYWNEILNMDALVRWGTISPEDLNLFRRFDEVEPAFEYLRDELTRHYVI